MSQSRMMIVTNGNRSRSRLSPTAMVRELSKDYQKSKSPATQKERAADNSVLKQQYEKLR